MVLPDMCSCSGSCNSPISRSGSPGCNLRIILNKSNGNRDKDLGFQVYVRLGKYPLFFILPDCLHAQFYSYDSVKNKRNASNPE